MSPRTLAMMSGLIAILGAIVASPQSVGLLLADDGTIDNVRVILVLRALAFGFTIAAFLSFAVALAPERAARIMAKREAGFLLVILAAAVPLGVAVVYGLRNRVNPLAHLELDHPISRKIAASDDPWATWHQALIDRDW